MAAPSTAEVRGYQSAQRQQIIAAGDKVIDLSTGTSSGADPGTGGGGDGTGTDPGSNLYREHHFTQGLGLHVITDSVERSGNNWTWTVLTTCREADTYQLVVTAAGSRVAVIPVQVSELAEGTENHFSSLSEDLRWHVELVDGGQQLNDTSGQSEWTFTPNAGQ